MLSYTEGPQLPHFSIRVSVVETVTPHVLLVHFVLGVGGTRTMHAYNPGTSQHEKLPLTVDLVTIVWLDNPEKRYKLIENKG